MSSAIRARCEARGIRNEGPAHAADHALHVRDPDGALSELTTSPLGC